MTHEFANFITHLITSANNTHVIPTHIQQQHITHAYATVAFALLRGNAAMARKLVTPQPPRDIPPHQHTYTHVS